MSKALNSGTLPEGLPVPLTPASGMPIGPSRTREALHAPSVHQPLPADSSDLERLLLGGLRRYRRRDAARAAGVSVLSARKLWRALGFASVDEDDVAFTDGDVAALERSTALVREELVDETTLIAFARALGHTTDRLVNWQLEALLEYLSRHHVTDGQDCQDNPVGDEAVVQLAELLPDLEALLIYIWRRKLASAVHRLERTSNDPGVVSDEQTVGFADLVSYTRLSLRLSQHQLGALVQSFEATAADVVTAGGGQLIKTVGDEVLFTADEPVQAAVIGLTLTERMSADELLPDVRVGIANGPVLHSLGDVFGATVNLASRLTALAEPATVATDPSTAQLLSEAGGFVLVPQRPREVSGLGTVHPLLITRSTPECHRLIVD